MPAPKDPQRRSEWLRKISVANKGKTLSSEHRKKIADSHCGERNPMYGKKGSDSPFWGGRHTNEARQKMSAVHKGKTISAEHKKALSMAHKGVPKSLEHRKKIGLANTGKPGTPFTPEMRELKRRQSTEIWARMSPAQREERIRKSLQKVPRVSSIEHTVRRFLSAQGVDFVPQKRFGTYLVDICVERPQLAIECDGRYWHSSVERKKSDAKKDRLLAKQGYTVVRLGELDIKADVALAVQRGLASVGLTLQQVKQGLKANAT